MLNRAVIRRLVRISAIAIVVAGTAWQVTAQMPSRPGVPTPPARDTSARPAAADDMPAGRIAGRVVAADSGNPVARARVVASSTDQGRGTLTNADGTFEFTELPDGRYTVTASKSGFLSLAFGQRRPLQPGTPVDI